MSRSTTRAAAQRPPICAIRVPARCPAPLSRAAAESRSRSPDPFFPLRAAFGCSRLRAVSRGGRGTRLPCTGGTLTRRWTGACRQDRAPARSLRRGARARSLADRSEPLRRRAGRARARRTVRSAARGDGRDVRRAVRGARAHGDGEGRRVVGDAERALAPTTGRRARSADGSRYARYPDAVGHALGELDGALLEPGGRPRAARVTRRRLSWRARAPRRVGPRRAPAPGDRAPDRGSRRLAREPGLRARLRRPHRCRVAAARGAFRPHRRARLAAVRARSRCRTPRCGGLPTISRSSRTARSSSSRPARPSSCPRRWRTSSGPFSPTHRLPRGSTDRSGSSRAPACAARSSS